MDTLLMESLLIPYQAVDQIPGSSVICFAPHPDDEVFGCGGSLCIHARIGIKVNVVVVSDGAYGKEGEEKERLVSIRQSESRAAAVLLGYPEPCFWRLPDRGVEYGEALIARMLEATREAAADLVYAPSLNEMHPDHRSLAMAAVEVVRRLGKGVRLAMYEVSTPLSPNLLLDISVINQRKQEAMQCFTSQLAMQAYDTHITALNRYRTYSLPAAVTAAEAFSIHDGMELAKKPLEPFIPEHIRQARLGLPMSGKADIPLISVVVRSMDRDLLVETLDSLALQTYSNIEVLVVNAKGGEHRGLGAACGRFPLRLINAMGPPLRRSVAANAGLDAARGELVALLDDDDTVDPDHYAHLVDVLHHSGPGCVAYAGVRCVSRSDPERKTILSFAESFSTAKLLAGNFIPIHAPLFPCSWVRTGLRFDENFDTYEDWDFWLQLARHTRFIFAEKITATYFTAGDSGVSFDPDQSQIAHASQQLYAKWHSQINATDLFHLCDYFRQQTQALADMRSSHEQMVEQLASVTTQLNDTLPRLIEVDARLVDVTARHLEAEAQRQDAEAQLQNAEAKLLETKALMLEAASRLTETESRLNAADTDLAETKSRLTTIQTQLADSRAEELNAVYNSISWRITAPLRFLLTILRR